LIVFIFQGLFAFIQSGVTRNAETSGILVVFQRLSNNQLCFNKSQDSTHADRKMVSKYSLANLSVFLHHINNYLGNKDLVNLWQRLFWMER